MHKLFVLFVSGMLAVPVAGFAQPPIIQTQPPTKTTTQAPRQTQAPVIQTQPVTQAAPGQMSGQAPVQAVPQTPTYASQPAANPAGAATGASARMADGSDDGGYSTQVLQKVLPLWQPPAGTIGPARILVRISSQGRVLSCEPAREGATIAVPGTSVGTQAIPGTSATVTPLSAPPTPVAPQDRALADRACLAVAGAGDFGVPPYGLIAEVILTLPAGGAGPGFVPQAAPMGAPSSAQPVAPAYNTQPSQPVAPAYTPPAQQSAPVYTTQPATQPGNAGYAAQPTDYADVVLKSVQRHIVFPPRLMGQFSVGVTLHVRGDGGLDSFAIHRSSGNKDVDAAIVQAVSTPGVIPAPPGGMPREVRLTYTLSGQ